MRLTFPRLRSRHSRLVIATTIALALAATHVAAQFSSFPSASEGELWGVRQELVTPVGGYPSGVAYVNGTLFVADAGNATVIAYDNAGEPIGLTDADWADTADEASPAYGLAPNQLFGTTVMKDAVPTTAVLVSDGNSHRVLAFDTAGAHLFTLQLARPGQELAAGATTGIALAPDSQFVLTTTGPTPVLELEGSFAAGWTNEWESDGVVLTYKDLASVPYIAGSGRFEATPGKVLTGQEGNNLAPAPQLPYGVVFDADGNLYTVDTNTERLNVYDPTLEHLFTFGTPAPDGSLEEFNQPYGMAFAGDRLIVADPGNHRLAVYRPDLINDELDFLFYIKGLGDGWPKSVAVDSVTGRIAASDLNDAAARVWVFETPNLATFNVQVLDDQGAPVEAVCLGTDYRVQFSVTVPAGRDTVSNILPTLSIDGTPVISVHTTGGDYSAPMQPGEVATYTYGLNMAADADVGDFVIEAGATASTSDVLFRQAVLSVADCSSDAPTITSSESHDRQLSGWTPIPPGETLVLTLTATDDEGVGMIEYQISGQNDPWVAIAPETFAGDQATESFDIELPEFGPSKVRFRARDNGNNKSAWQELEFRIQNVPYVQSNEGDTVSFSVGSPVGSGYVFSQTGLPHGATINAATGLISGQIEFDASGPYTVRVTESKAGFVPTWVEFEWTVNDVNRHPTIEPIGPQEAVEGEYFELQVVGSDPDGDHVIFTMSGLPDEITIDPDTGLISGIFPWYSDRIYNVTIGLGETPGLATVRSVQWSVANVNMAPMVISPVAQSNAEGDSVSLAIVASDPDEDTLSYAAANLPDGLTINPETGEISGRLSYVSSGVHAVTVEVSDGIIAPPPQVTFHWTVTDNNRPPVFTATLPDQGHNEGTEISIDIDATDDPGDILMFSAPSLPPGLSIDPATGVIGGTLSYDAAGTHAVTISVTDGVAPATFQFRWTVANVNRPPTILALANRTDPEGTVVTLDVTGSDLDTGAVLSYSATGLPAGVVISAGAGDISGTIAFSAAGPHYVTVTVSDGTDTATASFSWVVTAVNQPPTISGPDRTSNEGDTVAVLITHADLDSDALTFTLTGLPSTHTISAAGVINGTFDFDSASVHHVMVTVDDGTTTASTQFDWTVLNVNRRPILIVENQHSVEGQTVALQIAGSDPDHDAVEFTMTGLPTGFTIEPLTGIIRGTFDYQSAATYTVTIGVWDGVLTAVESFAWMVDETNRPPVVDALPNRADAENQTVSFAVIASDPEGRTLSYSAPNLPPGITIDSGTGLVSGTLAYNASGTHNVQILVSNGLAVTTRTFTWQVTNVNRPPVVTNPGPQNSAEGATLSLPISASDPDGQALTYSSTGLPPGLSINPSSGVISGSLTYAAAGTYSVTVRASDGSLFDEETFSWTVVDIVPTNHPPVCSATASAGDLWPPNHKPRYLSLAGITDPDDDEITIRYTGILQDEPVDAVGQGNTPDFDGGIEDNGASAWIRAERTGNPNIPGDGRVYLISYTATDAAGASCSGTTNLGVPHDQRGTPAVLSPGRWNSLNGQQVYAPSPDAVNDVASVKKGKSITIAVLDNDSLTLQPVAVTIVGAPSTGTATTNGQTITYLASSTTGSATLTYLVTGPFGTDTATVTIAIK